MATWFDAVAAALTELPVTPADGDADRHRLAVLERVGRAASDHRQALAGAGLSGRGLSGSSVVMSAERVAELCATAIGHLDATIRGARRADGLYHAYRLLRVAPDRRSAAVEDLPEMLEGQVAVLSSGVLTPDEGADLFDALAASALYRPDQRTFLLAPAVLPKAFLDKNLVPDAVVASSALLSRLLDAGDRSVVRRDVAGSCRFHPGLVDERRLAAALDALAADPAWTEQVAADREQVLAIYEQVFGHRAFLGRSGSMHAYEGIGSVYWHMVTKLLLAVQEAAVDAARTAPTGPAVGRLVDAYWQVRDGLGVSKSAREFGAVPTDPYSHTPAHAGAQQPGMTGAVKEELLARTLELGVRVTNGEVVFDPLLLRSAELLEDAQQWTILDVDGRITECTLPAGTLGFTLCQVPLIVGFTAGDPGIEVHRRDGDVVHRPGTGLGRELSAELFGRTGTIERIHATIARPGS